MPGYSTILKKRKKLRKKPDVIVRVRCSNKLHEIAIVNKKLVLVDHSKEDMECLRSIENLSETETKCKCRDVLAFWRSGPNFYLPAKLKDVRREQATHAIKHREYKPSTEQYRCDLLQELATNLCARLGFPGITFYHNPAEDTNESTLPKCNFYSYYNHQIEINLKRWFLDIVKNNIVKIDNKLILSVKFYSQDTAVCMYWDINNKIKNIMQTAVLRFIDNEWTLLPFQVS